MICDWKSEAHSKSTFTIVIIETLYYTYILIIVKYYTYILIIVKTG